MPKEIAPRPPGEKHRFTVVLPSTTGNLLIQHAQAERRAISREIEVAIEQYLERHRAKLKNGPRLA